MAQTFRGQTRQILYNVINLLFLPTHAFGRVVPPLGFEPRTHGLKVRYSDQLSYRGSI